ncbi:DUF6597 domain-containing transcriptional factor [Catellatospora aurea]|uniref:DUF6597 domain-containing transcriptional factor n=1 Tax=Catellatospora aurea TaxID=1337874 RepID=A0ABW2H825_9ACTN
MPGILDPRAAQAKFQFSEPQPARGLEPYVAHYWVVRWDLREQDPYEQHVLPYPSVNMTFKLGRCRIAGVPRGRFSEVLEGAGRVFGVRFTPAGFRAFLNAPTATITDKFLPVEAVFGPPGAALSAEVLAADEALAAAAVDQFLLANLSAPDPNIELVNTIVARIAAEPSVMRVDRLAEELQVGVRRLQRLFADYVGVGPKWVIRRYRLHEAAERAAADNPLDWMQLASELGYTDQAHLIRDFTAIIGTPPARYIQRQRS